MRDHRATREVQEAVHRAREAGIQAHIRDCKTRERAKERIALSRASEEKSETAETRDEITA